MTVTATPLTDRSAALVAWIAGRGGVVHSSDARAATFSTTDISGAVCAGALQRVRRSWLLTPDCDERRAAAAKVGGRLTCVSAAALRGLWVPPIASGEEVLTHVAVPGTASRLDAAGLRVHWGTGPAPVGRAAPDDHILNVLFHVAHCLSRRDALAVWESAIHHGAVEDGTSPGLRGAAGRPKRWHP